MLARKIVIFGYYFGHSDYIFYLRIMGYVGGKFSVNVIFYFVDMGRAEKYLARAWGYFNLGAVFLGD